jgi:hypothetical protein
MRGMYGNASRWDWLCRDWLGRAIADYYYEWEEPRSLPPRILTPPPRYSTRALRVPARRPVIRSWLGGVVVPTPT